MDLQIKLREHTPAILKVKVDTGAQGNTLPLRIYRLMFSESIDAEGYPKPGTTRMSRITIRTAYNGTTIPQVGFIRRPCQHSKSKLNAEFYIADVSGPAIRGLADSQKLQLVTVHCPITTLPDKPDPSANNDEEDLKRLYPDRFQGIEEFKGECHITLKDNAQPVVQAPRKYPIQLLPEIKAELHKMEKMEVITPVTEATDWVNSLAFSRKSSGGLRICLDPKDLNKNIKDLNKNIKDLNKNICSQCRSSPHGTETTTDLPNLEEQALSVFCTFLRPPSSP